MRSAAVRKSETPFSEPNAGGVFKQKPPFETQAVRTPQSRFERALNTFMAYASNGGGLEGFKYLLAAPAAAGTIAAFFGLVALDQYYGGSFLRLPPLPELMQLDSARAERELQASEVQVSSLMDAQFGGAAQTSALAEITVREAAKEKRVPRAKDVAPELFRTENFARAEASAVVENVHRDDTYAGVENVVREEIPAVENVLRDEAVAARQAREIVASQPESSPESVIAKIAVLPERASGVERIESAGAPAKTETPRVFSAGELPNQLFAPRPLAEEEEAKEAKSPSMVQGSEPDAPVGETENGISKTEAGGGISKTESATKTQGSSQENSAAAKKSAVKPTKAEPKTQTAVNDGREKKGEVEPGVKRQAVSPELAKPVAESRAEPAKAAKMERSEIRAEGEETKATDFGKQAVARVEREPIKQIAGTIERVERTVRVEDSANVPEKAKREERSAKLKEAPARSGSSVSERALVAEPIERVQETAARVEREAVVKVESAARVERAEKTVEVERPAERAGRIVEPLEIIERVDGAQVERTEKAGRIERAEIERPAAIERLQNSGVERPEQVERVELVRPETVERVEIVRPETVERVEIARPEKVERVEIARPEKVERVEIARPEKVERVERIERSARLERPEKIERPAKAERPEKIERVERLVERLLRPERRGD